MRRRGAALVVLVGLTVPAACSDDGLGEGEARLEVDGIAVVERADGDRDTVSGSADLRRGDRVSVQEGLALMRLTGGTVLELREGFDDAADTTVVMGERPELEAGELLVTTPDVVELEADGTEVRITEGAARLTRAFGMSVAAYDADIALDSAGVAAEVPALRRMVVPDLGRPPQRARPITYDDADTWDRRFLGAAMALGQRLEDFSEGLTRALPEGEGRTPGYFRLVLPGLDDEPDFDRELLAPRLARAPGENLIGAAIADLGERGDFTDRWTEVFGFRDAGAEWGIVALDQAVRSDPLVGSVEDAINVSFEEAAALTPASPPAPATAPIAPLDTPPTGATPPAGAGPVGGDPSTATPPTTPPPDPTAPPAGPTPTNPPVVPDPEPTLAPIVEPVTDVVSDLLGGLLG